MTYWFVGIGSNDNPEYHCYKMLEALEQRFGHLKTSQLCKTHAVISNNHKTSGGNAADYLNGVVCFESDISRQHLKDWCRQIEKNLGRIRGSDRCSADLDILSCTDEMNGGWVDHVEECYYRSLAKDLVASDDVTQ
ncbi:hypothetical protein CI610_02349 [invertebrate metagenome]|uniref:2-amino-4-hydroxy-6-hydroxymethyldihydropteridine diphosphokinase n=1 Tax=invertebrate metagenome TaxID=1711999 RepID=A0A2H9T644_9ZZZZ